MKTTYTDLSTGEALDSTDPRTMSSREDRIAAAAAEQAAFENQTRTPANLQQFETRSKRTGQRVFVVRCCNWSTSSTVQEDLTGAIARHDVEYHHS